MKAKTKLLLTSMMSIAFASSLIAGSTYALFTDKAEVNIAVTSGKIKVEASVDEDSFVLYSLKEGVQEKLKEGTKQFVNGGLVGYNSETATLSIDRITPGDKVEFDINVENKSNVAIKYRTVLSADKNDELLSGLKVAIDEKELTAEGSKITSSWEHKAESVSIDPIHVSVELPLEVGNEYQDKKCKIVLSVEAVQGNVGDYVVESSEDFQTAIDNVIDGGTISVAEEMTFTEETPIVIPEDKDVTIDLNGNDMIVSQENEGKQNIVVSEGSSLTITDSTPGDGEKGKFELNVAADNDNLSAYKDGIYALRVEGGTLNLEGVDFNINHSSGSNHAIFVSDGGKVNVDENTNIEFVGGDDSFAFYIAEGSMDINGAYLHSYGRMAPITVGSRLGNQESVVNFNEGSVFDYEASGGWAPAFQAYPNGVVNIEDNTELNVYGKIPSGDAAVALGTIGGGTINVNGGEITLAPETGEAYAVMTRANYFYAVGASKDDDPIGQMSMANITFSGSSKIKAVYGNNSNFGYIFVAQKNYVYNYAEGFNGYDDSYAITIEPSAQILYGKTEDTLEEIGFSHKRYARVESGYEKVGAILDKRDI